MTPSHRETVVVLGVVVLLLGFSVAPFLWPLLPGPVTADPVTGERTTDGSPGESSDESVPFRERTGGASGAVEDENVSVAVLDPQGFDVEHPRISRRVVATRSFWQGRSITNQGRNAHGTASALTVVNVAPDVDLYLANFNGSRDFFRAVDWAIERDVDVIVAPVSFYGKPNDGSSVAARAVERAAEAGITVVVPTGNLARKHWQGTYDGDGWVSFSGQRYLRLEGTDRDVELWARWNDSESGRTDFQVVLLRDDGGELEQVATSNRFQPDQVGPNQVLSYRPPTRLSTTVSNGSYLVAVRGPPNETRRFELYSASHRFVDPEPNGSLVAPATADAEGVVAVGATHREEGSVELLPASSRGPTNDGRRGVDVVAPGYFETEPAGSVKGTSFAASYTGGVVALMIATNPELSPARVEEILQETTLPAGPPGADDATGHGSLDPAAAIARARSDGNRSRSASNRSDRAVGPHSRSLLSSGERSPRRRTRPRTASDSGPTASTPPSRWSGANRPEESLTYPQWPL